MDSQVSVRRSRGAVSGAVLMLLGLWGGLAPFVGSYLHFGYTPDTAWTYTTGRLYYSALPGAAALAGGLLAVTTRNRIIGATGGILATLGGLWFVIGPGVMTNLVKRTNISLGVPFGATAGATSYTTKEYLEVLALYTALGAVIIFFGAIAAGRFSLVSMRDVEEAGDIDYSPSSVSSSSYSTGSFPSVPAAGEGPTSTFAPRSAPFNDAPRLLSPGESTQ